MTRIQDPRIGHGAWRDDPAILRRMSRRGRDRVRLRTVTPRVLAPPGLSGIPWVRALQVDAAERTR